MVDVSIKAAHGSSALIAVPPLLANGSEGFELNGSVEPNGSENKSCDTGSDAVPFIVRVGFIAEELEEESGANGSELKGSFMLD